MFSSLQNGAFVWRRRSLLAWPLAAAPLAGSATAPITCRALLIGNSRYQRNAVLPNATHDTRLLAQALQRHGVEVEQRLDLTLAGLEESLRGFLKRVERAPGTVAWISFAGHAVQLDGKNYLQGVDSDFSSPVHVRRFGYDLDELLFQLNQTRPAAAVVTLDACRNNPFKPELTRGGGAGLAPVSGAGVLVSFSTAPYMRALDGPASAHSPYARALADALSRPGTLEAVFRETADAVYRSTGQKQVPEYRSSLRAQWRFGPQGVELHPLPAAPTGATAGGVSRSVLYRPDVPEPTEAALSSMTPQDWDDEAQQLYRQMHQADVPEAQQLLAQGRAANATPAQALLAGMLLEEGRALQRDRLGAMALYERAALRGHAVAQTLLGELHYARRNYPQAYRWLSVAAEAGLPRARMNLAQLQLEGKGTRRDAAAALDNLRSALPSSQPTPDAQDLARDLERAMRDKGLLPAR